MFYPDVLLENELWSEGFKFVGGIDEAGRGPWAGPVSVGLVVIMPSDEIIEGVADSKKLTEKKREIVFSQLENSVTAYGVGLADNEKIDRIGIQKSILECTQDALRLIEEKLGEKVDYLIADGPGVLSVPGYKMRKIVKGDMRHYSIAAASIFAKVTRDRLMKEYAKQFPEYGFERHVGYGTKAHLEALKKYGICPIHRRSYKPISVIISAN